MPDPTKPPAVTPAAGTEQGVTVRGGSTEVSVQAPETNPAAPPARPEWLPEGYDSPEAFRKSYDELRARAAPVPPKTEEQTTQAATAAGLDLKSLSAEYAEKGELSAESLEKLKAAGVTKDDVDFYVAGQKAKVAAYENDVMSEVGGKVEFERISKWAQATLTDTELKDIDSVLTGGNAVVAKLALSGLQARYHAANGKEPSLVRGGVPVVSGGVQPYSSQEAVVQAMSDVRYKRGDPDYHAEVQARLALTPMGGH